MYPFKQAKTDFQVGYLRPLAGCGVFFLLLLLFSPKINGQTANAELEKNARSSDLLNTLAVFEKKLKGRNKDSLDFYAAKVQRLLPGIKDPATQAKAAYLTGDYFRQIYLEYDSAQVWYQKALDLEIKHPQPELRLEILPRIAYNCYALTTYQLAADYATEGIELAKKLGNRSKEAECLGTMASIMSGYGDEPQKALDYASQAMEINRLLGDTGTIISSYIRIASMQAEMGKPGEALRLMEEAGQWLAPDASLRQTAEILFWRGSFLAQKKDYEPALAAMQQAVPLYEKLNDRFRIMHILLNEGSIYLAQGQPGKAVEAGKKVTDGSLRPGLYELNEGYKLLYQAYKLQGDAASALRFHERYFTLNDSIRLLNKDRALAELDLRFQSKEKERQLAHERAALSTEKQRKWGFLAGLLLTLAALAFALFAFFKMRKARQLLAEQNLVISRQKEALQHLDEMKTRFFANVSHELRTPLTLMLGPIGAALKSSNLDQRNIAMLKLARQHGKHLLKLVNEILDLSKLQAGKLELNESPVEFLPFLKRITGYFESHAERQGIRFFFDYRPDPGLVLELDAARFETILNNLLSNAIKFTSPGSPLGVGGKGEAQVGVRVEDLAHSIRLSVSDTGRGIHSEDLPQVFDRFYQSKQPGAPSQGGTGIGLALCRELAELMQGKIGAESELGKGSTFIFEFPKKEVFGAAVAGADFEEEDKIQFQPAAATPAATAAATILVVEDNASLRDYLRLILSEKYTVRTAENGQAALEQLRANSQQPIADLILSDVIMPEMDGYELLRQLKSDEQLRHLPVMLLTARVEAEDQFKALRIGADDYLLKPFEDDELLARVEKLLRIVGVS